jgi:hypothetical protein
MDLIDQFAVPRGWRITSWGIDRPGRIPEKGFVLDGSLVIGIVARGTESCSLSWLDGNNKICSGQDLDFEDDGDTVRLHRDEASVSFGDLDVVCQVTILLLEEGIRGTLHAPGDKGEDNTGTFIAVAIPPPVGSA